MEASTVQHPVFFGEYDVAVDDKNRLLVPAEVRRCLKTDENGSSLFVKPGTNVSRTKDGTQVSTKVLLLYPGNYYRYLGNQQQPDPINPTPEAQFQNLRHFALASELDIDKQGRVLVPERMFTRAELKKDLVLLGLRDHLELWNRTDWEKLRDELL